MDDEGPPHHGYYSSDDDHDPLNYIDGQVTDSDEFIEQFSQ